MRYRIKDKQQVIEWFNNFADYIEQSDNDLYQQAIDFADDMEIEFWKSLDNTGQGKVGQINNTQQVWRL